MTPEMIAHYMEVFHIMPVVEGIFVAIGVIIVVVAAIRAVRGG